MRENLENIVPGYNHRTDMLADLLLADKVDFALINWDIQHPAINKFHIHSDKMFLAVPASHPKAITGLHPDQIPPVSILDFRNEKFILQPHGQMTRNMADKLLKDANIKPDILLETRSIPAAVSLVAQNCGVCFIAEPYLDSEAYTDICILPISQQTTFIDTYIAHKKGIYMPQYFEYFLKIAKDVFGKIESEQKSSKS